MIHEKQWYIVKCPLGIEEKFIKELEVILIKMNLSQELEDYFIPTYNNTVSSGKKLVMANYVFLKISMNEDIKNALNKIKYASFMLSADFCPEMVPQETIINLRNKEKEKKLETIDIEDEVIFLEGDFKDLGFKGLVKKVDQENQSATIEIRILGSSMMVVLPFTAIKVINNN